MATEVDKAIQQEHAPSFQHPPQLSGGLTGDIRSNTEKPATADTQPAPPSGAAPTYEPPRVEEFARETGPFGSINGGYEKDVPKEPAVMTPALNSHSTDAFPHPDLPAEKSTDNLVKEKPAAPEPAPIPDKPAQLDFTAERAPERAPERPAAERSAEPASIHNKPAQFDSTPAEVLERAPESAPEPAPEPASAQSLEKAPTPAHEPVQEKAPAPAPAPVTSGLTADTQTASATSSAAGFAAAAGPAPAGVGASGPVPEATIPSPANGRSDDVEMKEASPAAEPTAAAPPASKPVPEPAAPPAALAAPAAVEPRSSPAVGEKRKADELLAEEPAAANGDVASGKNADGAVKTSPQKKLKLAAGKFVDKAKNAIGRSKSKREKKPAPAVGRAERKTRSQGPVDA